MCLSSVLFRKIKTDAVFLSQTVPTIWRNRRNWKLATYFHINHGDVSQRSASSSQGLKSGTKQTINQLFLDCVYNINV